MRNFFRGFIYAWKGIRYAFASQVNFRFHTVAALIVIIAGWYLQLDSAEWLWISAAIAAVFISELFNTAIETIVDLVSPAYHPKAGVIKDLSSAAVLVTAFFAFIAGLLIFIPKMI